MDLGDVFTREVSNLPKDTQQQTSDRCGIQSPRSGSSQPHPGVRLKQWFPNKAQRSGMGSWYHGFQHKVSRCPHSLLGKQEIWFNSSGEKKIEESGVVSFYKETNCPIKIIQPIKKKSLPGFERHLVL